VHPSHNSDADLARALVEGRTGAFDEFVESYRTKLFRYSFLMCGQREDAEEVAQETLLRVFESLDQLRDPARLKSWVFRIAKNCCLMKRRKGVFAPDMEISLDQVGPQGGSAGSEMDIADWSAVPEKIASDTEFRAAIHRAIQGLPELYRSVFLLRDIEELTTDEAAHVLEVSEDVIKTRLHRARSALRGQLEQHFRTSKGADVH
jgi:RNA polymerase sigma-70 factor (ECF subfamily)